MVKNHTLRGLYDIIGVLCVAYFPAHLFAEQLLDHTNTAVPSVPKSISNNNKYMHEKTDGQEQENNFTQLFQIFLLIQMPLKTCFL